MITDATKALLSFSVPPAQRYLTPAEAQFLTLIGVSALVDIERQQLALAKSATAGGGTASNVTVDNFPATQTVDGTVAVSNFPATQPISGSITIDNFPATQPISAASLPLPALASTSTLQTTGNTSLASIDTKVVACDTGAVTIAGGTVSIASSVPTTRVPNTAATYQAATAALAVVALASDIFTITGSASKTVYVTKLTITATRTSGAQTLLQLIKRSAANSGGTSTTPTPVPFDSTSAAATAVVRAYTVNPTPGAAVGTIYAANYFIAGTSTATTPIVFDFGATLGQPITLRGTSEVLAVNLNGITVTGGSFNIAVEWEEAEA